MAFSYPLTMPASPFPVSVKWRLNKAQTESKSPFTFQTQTYDWLGSQWVVDVEYPIMTILEARAWVAFLLELQGKKGSFYFNPPDTPVLGNGGGTPVISSVTNRNTVVISGATANQSPWLMAGDYFSFSNGELKRCVSDANSNGSGVVTVNFAPHYRTIPTVSSQVATLSARGIFRLASSNVEFTVQGIMHHKLQLVFEEVI